MKFNLLKKEQLLSSDSECLTDKHKVKQELMKKYSHIKVGSQVTFSFNKNEVYTVQEIDLIARTAFCLFTNPTTNQEETIELPLQTIIPVNFDGSKPE